MGPKARRVKKRKMVKAKKRRKEMTRFNFVVTKPRHFVLHIPNTPPHDIIISTIEKKTRKFFFFDRLRKKVRQKNTRKTREMQDQSLLYDLNISYKFEKNTRDGVSLKKQ